MYIYIYIYTAGGQQFGLLAYKENNKPYPLRILSSVVFSWHLADWISEFRLISIIYLKRPGSLIHPTGENI